MKGLGLIFALTLMLSVGSAPALAPAASTSRPVETPADQAVSLWEELRPEQWFSFLQNLFSASSAKDWPAAEKFIREHSPRRWEAFDSLQPDSTSRRAVRRLIVARYKSLMEMKQKDPQMYKLQLRELELEDDIFGITVAMRGRRDASDLRDNLRKDAAELVDTRLNIRQLRIERLEQAVQTAKKRLEKDRQRRDALVEHEIRTAAEHAHTFHRSWSGRRGGFRPATRPAVQPDE